MRLVGKKHENTNSLRTRGCTFCTTARERNAPTRASNAMHERKYIVVDASHAIHERNCIVVDTSHTMHERKCIVVDASHDIHERKCIVVGASHAVHERKCIVVDARTNVNGILSRKWGQDI